MQACGACKNFTPNRSPSCSQGAGRLMPRFRIGLILGANLLRSDSFLCGKAGGLCESLRLPQYAHANPQTCCQGASVVMKQDLNSTNTHTHTHCRWKSGYPSHLSIEKALKPMSRFRKGDSQKRTPRKTGQLPPHSAPVIRFLHRQYPANLRRPVSSVGISVNQNKMRKLPCTSFSQASNLVEENQLQTAIARLPEQCRRCTRIGAITDTPLSSKGAAKEQQKIIGIKRNHSRQWQEQQRK